MADTNNALKAQNFTNHANILKSDLSKVNSKIELLESAKRKLKSEIENYSYFQKLVYSKPSNISETVFRGSNRKKFMDKMKKVNEKIKSNLNHHNENLGEINAKLVSLNVEASSLQGSIADCLSSASSLLNS
ncbi:MAG: hypothetical protein LBM02_03990 [Lachnospiraceae bacterium]|jgi:prefoldin subunit 5|nr:hypothetical protein [Lachnospiraceae bacterium]